MTRLTCRRSPVAYVANPDTLRSTEMKAPTRVGVFFVRRIPRRKAYVISTFLSERCTSGPIATTVVPGAGTTCHQHLGGDE